MKITIHTGCLAEIDYSTPQLLETGNTLVLTNGNHTCNKFEATVIKSKLNDYKTGDFHKDFDKTGFKKFKQAITLENA